MTKRSTNHQRKQVAKTSAESSLGDIEKAMQEMLRVSCGELFASHFSPKLLRVLKTVDRDATKESYCEPIRIFVGRVMFQKICDEVSNLKQTAERGDQHALRALFYIAKHSTNVLARLAAESPQLVRPIARHESFWPFPVGRNKLIRELIERTIDKIELAKDYNYPADPNVLYSRGGTLRHALVSILEAINEIQIEEKIWLGDKMTTHPIERLIVTMNAAIFRRANPSWCRKDFEEYLTQKLIAKAQEEGGFEICRVKSSFPDAQSGRVFVSLCLQLPVLTADRKVIKRWMQPIKYAILNVHNGHPENNPRLRWHGVFLEKAKGAKRGSGTAECNIREGIFRQIEAMLTNIARRGRPRFKPAPVRRANAPDTPAE